jgi:hypothetical protein
MFPMTLPKAFFTVNQTVISLSNYKGILESYPLLFIQLYRWFPSILKAITIFRPETLVRWHRAGFRRYWRWKSRNLGGRPQIAGRFAGIDPADER